MRAWGHATGSREPLPRGARLVPMLALVIASLLAATGGCRSRSVSTADDPAASSIGRLTRVVERYRIDHRGQVPRSEQELRGFVAAMNPADRAALGVESVDACLVSDRDGQPVCLVFGGSEAAAGEPAVVCYERQGRDGVRLVGKVGGDVELADETRFRELIPAR